MAGRNAMKPPVRRGNVLGVMVSTIDLPAAVNMVMDAARQGQPLGLSALAVHGIMEAVSDPTFQYRLNDLELVVADGQPVRWALHWLHGVGPSDKVPGPDLMYSVCERAASEGLGVFLYGSTPETLASLRERLESAFPSLRVSGVKSSRFRPATEADRERDLETIRDSGAAVVFVGLGCPRQEIWTFENRLDLSIPVMAVGAAFDYHAGLLRRSPRWMQRAGLEWLYRLLQEPRRLATRYLKLNPAFLAFLTLQKIGLRRFPEETAVRPPHPIRPG